MVTGSDVRVRVRMMALVCLYVVCDGLGQQQLLLACESAWSAAAMGSCIALGCEHGGARQARSLAR